MALLDSMRRVLSALPLIFDDQQLEYRTRTSQANEVPAWTEWAALTGARVADLQSRELFVESTGKWFVSTTGQLRVPFTAGVTLIAKLAEIRFPAATVGAARVVYSVTGRVASGGGSVSAYTVGLMQPKMTDPREGGL